MQVISCLLFCHCDMSLTNNQLFDLVPKLSINSIVLAEHYYSLLVAVFHWLRYLIATDKSICDQNIGDIWIKCLRCIAKAITDCKSDDVGYILNDILNVYLLSLPTVFYYLRRDSIGHLYSRAQIFPCVSSRHRLRKSSNHPLNRYLSLPMLIICEILVLTIVS